MTAPEIYDAADSILQQKSRQVTGVGQVFVGGGSLARRSASEVNPMQLSTMASASKPCAPRSARSTQTRPKATFRTTEPWHIVTTDQLFRADRIRPLVVAYQQRRRRAPRRSRPRRRFDVEDLRNFGLANGKPAVLIIIFRQPGANIIETVDRIAAALPLLKASIPPAINLNVVMDRTTTIRASVHDVEITLLISITLVILVVFVFLRNVRATIIPSVAVPVSLIGTFGVMYLSATASTTSR